MIVGTSPRNEEIWGSPKLKADRETGIPACGFRFKFTDRNVCVTGFRRPGSLRDAFFRVVCVFRGLRNSFPAKNNSCRMKWNTYLVSMNEIVFTVTQETDGGYTAEALGENIFTQADSWEELRENARESVRAFYFDRTAPQSIRLHLVRDEVLSA